MRKVLHAFALGVLVLEVLSVAGRAQVIPPDPIVPPPSLKTVQVPRIKGIEDFVKDQAAAVALGKALFWDMQVGGDGVAACATCHFQAGVDSRTTNQLNPGANQTFEAGGPNHKLVDGDYPFHQLSDVIDRNSAVVRDRDDITGSQGVHNSRFIDIVSGGKRDQNDVSGLDPNGFSVGGVNVRRVTGRNTPSAINAVFNVRNFWDGRASRRFNGRNPFGDADVNARVLRVNDLGELDTVHISLDMASTASQAVGPPLSNTEMSGAGRTFMKLGKKMLKLQPLAQQEVKSDDSVLGPMAIGGGKGLATNYPDMIRAAFFDKWWNSNLAVDAGLNVIPGVTVPTDGHSLPNDQYTVMEANFSLFWGLAIAAYEATLVSDDSPFDRFREGDMTAMSPEEQYGMNVFLGKDGGNCAGCHAGPEFTGAAVTARLDPTTFDGVLERMVMGNRELAVYDGGFYNIGVRPSTEDVGIGASDPFGNPLSLARRERANPGSVQDNRLYPPVAPDERVAADGAFKVPSLRNVELTGPYFHNGGIATLMDVVRFYSRGGDFHDQNFGDLDPDIQRLRGLIGHPGRQIALAAFLTALTDDRVRWYRAPFDHPELVVANGAQGNEVSVLQDLMLGTAADAIIRIPANGRGGASQPLRPFLNEPLLNMNAIAAPNPTASEIALFATDSISSASRMNCKGDIWCNGSIRLTSRQDHSNQGDVIAGGNVTLSGDGMRLRGNVMAKGQFTTTATSFVDGVTGGQCEYFVPMAMPALPPLPNLPLVQAAVTVPDFGQQTIQPGRYGTISVGQGGWLILQPGVYVVSRISLGIGAYLQYDPSGQLDPPVGLAGEMPVAPLETVTIHVDDLDVARGAIISAGNASLSTHLKMFVRAPSSQVYLGPDSFFHGSLIAPSATFVMMSGSTLVGAAYAQSIDIAETAQFTCHSLSEDQHPFTQPGFANLNPGPMLPQDGESEPSRLGVEFALSQNTPNPCRMGSTFRFGLPEERDVDLKIFDVAGRAVKTLAQGPMGPGMHTLQWDGTSDAGTRLGSGVYFYRISAGADRAQRKLVIVD
jgi:cytochrome c peroxidase